jgi:hypothetical protein
VLHAAAVALGKLVKYFESVMPTDALKTHLESFLEALDGRRVRREKKLKKKESRSIAYVFVEIILCVSSLLSLESFH